MDVRILTRSDVRGLLDPAACADAVEAAFRDYGLGRAPAPAVASVPAAQGGFHVKAGILERGRPYFVAKANGNFPGNPARHRLPTIQGTIVLADAERGTPLAVMDSIEITALRTAAATAVAVKWLARDDARTLAVIGCGTQGRAHLAALRGVRRFEAVVLCDANAAAARELAGEERRAGTARVSVEGDATRAARAADVCVTCTPSREFVLDRTALHPGLFVAGVGADNEEKQELAPDLLANATIVTDVLEQCATFGDLHHAIDAGAVGRGDVYADLGTIVAEVKAGRRTPEEVIVFDSTGMALQDAAAAALVYELAIERGVGVGVDLAG
jgi:ornithine cyclodeaminase/alanine dehydrogenase-like protein (mu-crystallin family)